MSWKHVKQLLLEDHEPELKSPRAPENDAWVALVRHSFRLQGSLNTTRLKKSMESKRETPKLPKNDG